jgi:hypothetical protein
MGQPGPADPSPARAARDRLLTAAACFVLAASAPAIAASALRLADTLNAAGASTTTEFASLLSLAGELAALAAAASFVLAFAGRPALRGRRLVRTGGCASAGYAAATAAGCFAIAAVLEFPHRGSYLVGLVLGAISSTCLLLAFAVAALAFAEGSVVARDRRLAGTARLAAAGYAFALGSAIEYRVAFGPYGGSLTTGLWFEAAGALVTVVAASIAAVALRRSAGLAPVRREAGLARAAAALIAGFVLAAAGETIAVAGAGYLYSGTQEAAAWLSIAGRVALALAAAAAAVGFRDFTTAARLSSAPPAPPA